MCTHLYDYSSSGSFACIFKFLIERFSGNTIFGVQYLCGLVETYNFTKIVFLKSDQ